MARAKSSNKTANANGDAGSNGNTTVSQKKIPSSALQMSSAADSNAAKAEVPLSSRVTDTSVYASVSEDRIRQRAYELYMQRGGKHGAHVDDWFRAEAELRGRR
ncbi:MAG: hypothetical protein DMG64_04390 [Acidobacteria bacterium]|nr:MAG: hypothetical protein DMG64_04390 [Acidobacteriota bacterium]PYY24006.1 MAG: hypothetical protein DMG62_06065 [Acidobacteriota bacterium]